MKVHFTGPVMLVAVSAVAALVVSSCSTSQGLNESAPQVTGSTQSQNAESNQSESQTSGPSDGAESGSDQSWTPMRPGESDPTPADTSVLDALPAAVHDSYLAFWNDHRVGPNPYAEWTPPAAPWKFCYSSAYQGNAWRVEGVATATMLTDQLRQQGLVKGDLTVTDANNDASLQANQLNNLTQQGCNVIFVMQPPTVGECAAFQAAKDAGVLVVVMQTGTECTNVITSDFSGYAAGTASATWLASQLKSGDTVVMCDGIPGISTSEARQSPAKAIFQKAGLKVDSITGEWNAATIKTQMLNYLATHPGAVQGVWDGGVCAEPVISAFKQVGRTLPVVTGFEGACSWMAATHDNDVPTFGFAAGAGSGVSEAFRVALRMLSGQKPVVGTLLFPLQQVNPDNFDEYYNSAMKTTSTCSIQPLGGQSSPEGYYAQLFKGGNPAPKLQSVLNTKDLPIK